MVPLVTPTPPLPELTSPSTSKFPTRRNCEEERKVIAAFSGFLAPNPPFLFLSLFSFPFPIWGKGEDPPYRLHRHFCIPSCIALKFTSGCFSFNFFWQGEGSSETDGALVRASHPPPDFAGILVTLPEI